MKNGLKRIGLMMVAIMCAILMFPTVQVKAADAQVTSLTLDKNAFVLSNENGYEYTNAEIQISGIEEGAVDSVFVYYKDAVTEILIDAYFNIQLAPTVFEGNVVVVNEYPSGTYVLDKVEIYLVDVEEPIVVTENLPDSQFTLENNVTDFDAPVMSNIQIDKAGQVLQIGDTVTITANIEDVSEIYFSHLDLYNAKDEDIYIELEKQPDGTYANTITIDEEWLGSEWYVYTAVAQDSIGNFEYCYDDFSNLYFYVADEAGNYDEVMLEEASFVFYDQREAIVNEIVKENISHRLTLKELSSEITNPPADEKLGAFLGWSINNSKKLYTLEDTFLAEDGRTYITPVFEKEIINVLFEYINEEGEWDVSKIEYIHPRGEEVTYQDIIDELGTPEEVEGLQFLNWAIEGEDVELTDPLEYDSVYFIAVYDKQAVSVELNWIDEDGEWTYEDIVLILEKEVDVEDLGDQFDPVSNVLECTFIKWEFDGYYGSNYLAYTAVYDKYPAHIERTYIDNTGAVKVEKIVKCYPADTRIGDIHAEWMVTPSDASSDAITEWDYMGYEDEEKLQDVYNVQMTAQYADKNILSMQFSYIEQSDTCGKAATEDKHFIIPAEKYNETDVEEILKAYIAGLTLSHYDKLEVIDYNYSIMLEDNMAFVETIVDESQSVQLLIIDSEMNVYIYAAAEGETITLPSEVNGYEVVWGNFLGDEFEGSFTLPEGLTNGQSYVLVMAYGDKAETPEDNEEPGDTPEQGEAPEQDEEEKDPVIPEKGDINTNIYYSMLILIGFFAIITGIKRHNRL